MHGAILNRTTLIQLVESCERVACKMPLNWPDAVMVFTLAVREICKPDGRRGTVARWTVVTNIGPIGLSGLAVPGASTGSGSIVPVQLLRIEHIAAQNFRHRRQQRCCFSYHPGGQESSDPDRRLRVQRSATGDTSWWSQKLRAVTTCARQAPWSRKGRARVTRIRRQAP